MEANIGDISELERLKAALVGLAEEFRLALDEADSEFGRTQVWLDREIPQQWQRERRKRRCWRRGWHWR